MIKTLNVIDVKYLYTGAMVLVHIEKKIIYTTSQFDKNWWFFKGLFLAYVHYIVTLQQQQKLIAYSFVGIFPLFKKIDPNFLPHNPKNIYPA